MTRSAYSATTRPVAPPIDQTGELLLELSRETHVSTLGEGEGESRPGQGWGTAYWIGLGLRSGLG